MFNNWPKFQVYTIFGQCFYGTLDLFQISLFQKFGRCSFDHQPISRDKLIDTNRNFQEIFLMKRNTKSFKKYLKTFLGLGTYAYPRKERLNVNAM